MKASIVALLGGASTALAAIRGFNYAAQGQDYNGYVSQFKTAASLAGTSDFTSARLYTMIQEGTTNTPTSAIQAAIDTKTSLLLGLWASQDQATFDNEIAALQAAIQQYGSSFADLVVGIAVGSEDLYRISTLGIENGSGVGQSPDVLVQYISQTRSAIQGSSLGSTPVGHVDTWNVYVNSSNAEVISACDFLGLDEYPYYQATDENDIDNASFLFFQAYDRVNAVAGGRPIWITETGWPVSGPTSNLAIASTDNAEAFWQAVTCQLMARGIDFWYYILSDAGLSPSFGVSNNGVPLYSLTCNQNSTSSSSSSATSHSSTSHSASASASTATSTGSKGSSNTTASATATSSYGSWTTTVSTSETTGTTVGSSATSTGPATLVTSSSATQTAYVASPSTSSASITAAFTGAASRMEGSFVALAIGAGMAAFAL